MEISHLQIIRTLVTDPHLSRAALRLHMTQSALSKRLKAIEEEIGCMLFERRGPRGLKALPQASELAALAERVSTTWESGVKRIRSGAAEPKHFLLVGPQLFLREAVLPWWNSVASDFKGIELEVRVSPLSKISVETLQAGADAAILEHQEELPDYICRPIYTEHWGVVRNPKERRSRLQDYEWGAPTLGDNPVEQWLVRRNKMPPPSQYRFIWNDLTALARWISETRGAASVLPWHAVAQAVDLGKVTYEPLSAVTDTKLFLAFQKNTLHKKLIKSLTESLEGFESSGAPSK
jgi:DNA-binding transcriptional LysR family regulator